MFSNDIIFNKYQVLNLLRVYNNYPFASCGRFPYENLNILQPYFDTVFSDLTFWETILAMKRKNSATFRKKEPLSRNV